MSNTASAYRTPSRLRTAQSKRAHRRTMLARQRALWDMDRAITADLAALDAAEEGTEALPGVPKTAHTPAPRPQRIVWGYGAGPKQQAAEARRKALATADLFGVDEDGYAPATDPT